MKKNNLATKLDIETGSYFVDSIIWYNTKYLLPFTQRSYFMLVLIFALMAIFSLSANIYLLFPIKKILNYAVYTDDSNTSDIKLTKADNVSKDPIKSLIATLVDNYIQTREGYDYDHLEKQFLYVKNNSTRFIYTAFYNSMDLSNAKSPVSIYRRDFIRRITILSTQFLNDTTIEVTFRSDIYSKDNLVKKIDTGLWKVNLKISVDDLHHRLELTDKFNFSVISYTLNQLNQINNKS